MRIVIQRVSKASVVVNGQVVAAIGKGLLVLLGVKRGDGVREADFLVEKTIGLRIFPDEEGKMNRSIMETGGSLLVVSQFTLYGDCRKGRRPSFDQAAAPAEAAALYEYFLQASRARGVHVEAGVFQAHMDISLVNDGPVTIICDSAC